MIIYKTLVYKLLATPKYLLIFAYSVIRNMLDKKIGCTIRDMLAILKHVVYIVLHLCVCDLYNRRIRTAVDTKQGWDRIIDRVC